MLDGASVEARWRATHVIERRKSALNLALAGAPPGEPVAGILARARAFDAFLADEGAQS